MFNAFNKMIPQKRKIKKEDVCKTTRSERIKKLNKFQDIAHKNFGNPQVNGMGDGTSLFCCMCKRVVPEAKLFFYQEKIITVCVDCSFDPEKL